MTPKPAITGHDEPGSFFHFWRHHFWPKASYMLNFCRRKRSLQWCPGQSDRPYGAWDMHKNSQKVDWKSRSKISCHFTVTCLLHGQICPSHWCFLGSFLTASKPSRTPITARKGKEKEKKEEQKKKSKIEKPEDVGHFLVSKFWFLRMPEPKCRKIWC